MGRGRRLDALQEDYFRCLYGAAAGPVRELHESFERALVEHEPMMKGLDAFLSPEVIARGKELIREGWEAEGSDEVRSRLDVLAAQVEYGERLMGGAANGGDLEPHAGPRAPAAAAPRARCRCEPRRDNPVDRAYHLGGVGGKRGNINNYLTGNLWGTEEIRDHPFRRPRQDG